MKLNKSIVGRIAHLEVPSSRKNFYSPNLASRKKMISMGSRQDHSMTLHVGIFSDDVPAGCNLNHRTNAVFQFLIL